MSVTSSPAAPPAHTIPKTGWLPFRTPPLAVRNVVHGGKRSLAGISGVAFSLTMVLLQLGFLQAVRITATNNFDQLDFDVVLASPRYEQFYAGWFFPFERLNEARSVENVTSAMPLYTGFSLWRCPPYPLDRSISGFEDEPTPGAIERWLYGSRLPRPLQRRQLFVFGIDLEKNPFREPIRGRIEEHAPQLRLRNRVLLNELSNPDFGWQLRDRYDAWEMDDQAVSVVGGFRMLRGFAADSTVICSATNFFNVCQFPPGQVSLGLLKVREGTLDQTLAALKARMAPDVAIYSREEILSREKNHWVRQTSTGQLFAFGSLIAMVVATVVVYQVLSNDVREHLPEYATLKAMGYSTLRLARTVIEQSLIYVLVGYVIAVLLSIGVYWATEQLAGIPMKMTVENLGITLVLAILVGLFSGVLSVTKLKAAQPAELF